MESGALFVSADYLEPLESSGCAAPENGWDRLPGLAMPVYAKAHSWGEFVFDFAFAQAYAEQGLDYYPKLVCAVPFTPVPGPRLGGELSGERLVLLSQERSASSAHVLFLPEAEAAALQAQGWLLRRDLRFIWRQRGYRNFDDFLAALTSKKRKNIRAERRKLAALGLEIRWQAAEEFSAQEWRELFALYASTYAMRGQSPYLNLDCLRDWARRLPGQFWFCVARRQGELEAMAFFFRDDSTLYGRHWGSRIAADGLHFELCYYQGIEYCLAHGLGHLDAGVQGGHRLLRGFEPVATQSAHWFADQRFARAIGDYLARERRMMDAQLTQLCDQTAFAQRESGG